MKRITSLLLAFCLSISVAGCGSEEADKAGPALSPESSEATTTDADSGSAEKEDASGSAEKAEAAEAE